VVDPHAGKPGQTQQPPSVTVISLSVGRQLLRIFHPFQKPDRKISENRRFLSTQLDGIAFLKACQQAGFNNRRSGLLGFLRALAVPVSIEVERVPPVRATLTPKGETFANVSAAKPIHRKTAERVLAAFLERVNAVNATSEYLYRVSEVILFGSMLSDADCVGNVNVAVNLESKAKQETQLQKWCEARRRAAQATGRSFPTILEEAYWPMAEVYLQLKGKSHSLKLSELSHVRRLPNLSYQILMGDPDQLATLMPNGQVVPNWKTK
jgi:hypothetical protein